MIKLNHWLPSEIIVHEAVRDDEITKYFLSKCANIPVKYVADSKPETIRAASNILTEATGKDVLTQINAGKSVVHIAQASNIVVGKFEIEDKRMMCPEFDKLVYSSNGCFYKCDWCFLKGTYRANQNYITVRVEYDKIKEMLLKRLKSASTPVLFDTGEMADSLALEHLTKSARTFIPWFAEQKNGYMYMLTKSTNVNDLLDLNHDNHTILAWSVNSSVVASQYEVGAPTVKERITAAKKAQDAGYPIRLRLDPIVPLTHWQENYTNAIRVILKELKPERITLGTLRLEDAFYKNRDNLLQHAHVKDFANTMVPMLEKDASGSVGKYSFPYEQRVELFKHAIKEIRKYSDCDIALCKETKEVWEAVGLDLKECKCVCKYDSADMTTIKQEVIIMTTEKKATKAKTTKKTKTPKAAKPVTPEIVFTEKPTEEIEYEARTLYQLQTKNLNTDPKQPRQSIDEDELKELTASIIKHGVLQPILFRKDEEGNLIIVSGERRFQASKLANKETIPAMFIDGKPAEIALVENLLRVDLTAIEEAEALQRLKEEAGYLNKDLAAVIGKKESTISEILKLNQLPEKLRTEHRTNKKLSRRGLLEVAKAKDVKEMKVLFKKLIKKELKRDEVRAERKVVTRGADLVCRTMSKGLLKVLPDLDLTTVTGDKLTEVTKSLTDALEALANKLGYQVVKP